MLNHKSRPRTIPHWKDCHRNSKCNCVLSRTNSSKFYQSLPIFVQPCKFLFKILNLK